MRGEVPEGGRGPRVPEPLSVVKQRMMAKWLRKKGRKRVEPDADDAGGRSDYDGDER